MYPEDRVLVAYMPEPADFEVANREHWYRIPEKQVPKGLYAEYIAFYFGRKFGAQKWAIHYYAKQLGHELTTRSQLLPHQPNHKRANDLYYRVSLSALQRLEQPIVSLRWRRITFLHTTWDRFREAREINDLFLQGEPYVDRLCATLKERGIQPERNYRVVEAGRAYQVPLVVLCHHGRVEVLRSEIKANSDKIAELADRIESEVRLKGGVLGRQPG